MDDFAAVSVSVPVDLRGHVGLDPWLAPRYDEDDVVLTAVDDVFGRRAGRVYPGGGCFYAGAMSAAGLIIGGGLDPEPTARYSGSSFTAASNLMAPIIAADEDRLGVVCGLSCQPELHLQSQVRTAQAPWQLMAHEPRAAASVTLLRQLPLAPDG